MAPPKVGSTPQKPPTIRERAIEYGKQVKEVVTGGLSLKETVTDAFDAGREVAKRGMRTAWRNANRAVVQNATKASALDAKGVFTRSVSVGGGVAGVIKLPGEVATAVRDIRQAARTGSQSDQATAVSSTTGAASTVLQVTSSALTTTRDVTQYRSAQKAAAEAFRAAAPEASERVVSAASRAAARSTLQGASRQVVRSAVAEAATTAAKQTGSIARAVAGSGSRSAARAALQSGSTAAARAATRATVRAAAGPIARAAGRFAPGVNVAMAALDTASAAATLRDPNASAGKKVTSVITAAGSVVAATNIPIVSQAGAAISTVSGLVSGFFFSD